MSDKKTAPPRKAPAKKSPGKPQGKQPEKKDSKHLASDQVQERRIFYGRQVLWTKISAICTSISVVLLLAIGSFFVMTSKTTVYFQVDDQGQIVPLIPLSQPKHSDAFVGDWLNKCLVETYDFYHGNMDRHLQDMQGKCYNDEGHQSLMNGLRSTGNYAAIKEKELFASFSFNETPVVVRRKSEGSGPYRWMLQGEGILTLRTETNRFPNKALVTAIVTRSSLLDDNIGLSIEKLILKTSRIGN